MKELRDLTAEHLPHAVRVSGLVFSDSGLKITVEGFRLRVFGSGFGVFWAQRLRFQEEFEVSERG